MTECLGSDYRHARNRVRVIHEALNWMPYPGDAPTDKDMQRLTEARLEVLEFSRQLERDAQSIGIRILESINNGTHVLEEVV